MLGINFNSRITRKFRICFDYIESKNSPVQKTTTIFLSPFFYIHYIYDPFLNQKGFDIRKENLAILKSRFVNVNNLNLLTPQDL